jgi:hypothetical protein
MILLDSIVERLSGSFRLKPGRAFALGHTAAADLPLCDESRQSEERVIEGLTGVADRKVVCEKNAADAYAWRDKGHAYLEATYTGGGGGGSSLADTLMLMGG